LTLFTSETLHEKHRFYSKKLQNDKGYLQKKWNEVVYFIRYYI